MSCAAVPKVCPCESGRSYTQCCGPRHSGEPAQSAEVLMRSRYSAYALQLHDYLLASWHADTRPLPSSLEADAGQTRWLGLKVIAYTSIDATHATVEFVARYRVGGERAVRLHELSRFVYEDGRWWYIDGRMIQS